MYTHAQRHIRTSVIGRKGTARVMKVKQSTARELGSCQVPLATCGPGAQCPEGNYRTHTLVTPAQGPRGLDRQSLLIPIIQFLSW